MTKAQKIKIAKAVALNLLVLACLGVLTFASVDGIISPFAIAFLFAVPYVRANKTIAGIWTFVVSLFVSTGRESIISVGVAVAVYFLVIMILPRLVDKYRYKNWFRKFKGEFVFLFLFYILSHTPSVFFAFPYLIDLYIMGVNLIIGVIFLAVCLIVVEGARTRFNHLPWTIDQKICAGVFLMVVSLGLGGLGHDYFNVHKFVAVLIILISCVILDARGTMLVAVCLGIGVSFMDLNLMYVAVYSLLALAGISFRDKNRMLSVIAVVMTDLVLAYYFEVYQSYELYQILPLALACVIAISIPKKVMRYLDFSGKYLNGFLVSKNTINRNRQGIYKRMDNLSLVFNEMQNIYKSLVTGVSPPEVVAKMVARDITDTTCASCQNRVNCRREQTASAIVDNGLEKLCYVGLKNGSVDFMDVSADLSMRCTRLNAVLGKANALLLALEQKERANTHLDASKVLMAGLLSGISRLCKNFATDLCSGVVFDVEKAASIKDKLLHVGIATSDVLLTRSGQGEYSVSVLVPRDDARNLAIERVTSDSCGHKMMIECVDDAETAGFAITTVRTAPRYNLVFGVAQVSKDFNPTCGDTFTFLKITHNQSMMAVCDGMGAGESANRASVLALSLVENFYKAGFPHEVIMGMVNQLLIITEQEVFSAIDIAVFSLDCGMVNFVKVGGVDGFIKRAREVEVIEAGSLPLGVVEEMTPKVTRAHLGAGDMVILCSDGILDSFGDKLKLGNFINNLGTGIGAKPITPQKLADEIVAEALRRTDKIAIDDCTVSVAQIVEM